MKGAANNLPYSSGNSSPTSPCVREQPLSLLLSQARDSDPTLIQACMCVRVRACMCVSVE